MRVITFNNTLMMNNDGPVYIHQARAIYHGFWQAIGSCTVDYPTLYTLLIAAFYPLAGDWVFSAMAVNLAFGTLMIIPLYLFLRRFLDEQASFLTSFIFAMLPLFVIQSVNVIRDPSYWFFCILGLYFLVYNDKSKTPYALVLSSLSFLVATATRVEGLILIIGGCFYAVTVFKGRRFKAACLFLCPVLLLAASFVLLQVFRNPGDFYWYRFNDIPVILARAFEKYHHLEQQLTALISSIQSGILKEFLLHSRELIWFITLGVILQSALEAYFYFFFVLLLLGFIGLKDKIRNDTRLWTLIVIAVISLFVLYLYCLNIWSMENRRLATVIIVSSVIIGFGVEKTLNWLRHKRGLSGFSAVALLCILVLIITVPQNIKIQEADKLVYKEIGETIAQIDGKQGKVDLIDLGGMRWIHFYANLHVKEPPCPDDYRNWQRDKTIFGSSYNDFIRSVKSRNVRYIVWMENFWPKNRFPFLESLRDEDLRKLKEWHHRDTGKIILYKVRYKQ
jgi:4-amino-4-deoxy-L-arabinose transferase-like glycosyltransferase